MKGSEMSFGRQDLMLHISYLRLASGVERLLPTIGVEFPA